GFGEGVEEAEDSASGEAGGMGGGEHSTTNSQVAGIDEGDVVKTDGEYLYSISESHVAVTDIRNPENMEVAAIVEFDGETYPNELFLTDETLVVIASRYSQMETEIDGEMDSFMPYFGVTVVLLYDITAPDSPELIREFG